MGSAYAELLGHAAVADLFEPAAVLQAMLDIERAVVAEQARLGLVSPLHAQAIESACVVAPEQARHLVAQSARAGSLAIPLVAHLRQQVQARHPDALQAVHLGLTSQDLIDTTLSLQGRKAMRVIQTDLTRLLKAILALRHAFGDRVMVARTLLQAAAPSVLEARLLNWALPLQRCRHALPDRAEQALTLQLAGPVGTAGTWGPQAVTLREAVAHRLRLPLQAWSWHTQRDEVARLAAELGVLVGAVGKVATDVALMAQTEVGELTESGGAGRGLSSAMPHKRNPVGAMVALSALQRAPMRVAAVLGAMAQPYERAAGCWQAEGAELADLFVITASAVAAMADALDGAAVDVDRMAAHVQAFAPAFGVVEVPQDGLHEARAALWAQLEASLPSGF